MLKTYTAFMKEVNQVQAGIDLWTSVAKNATREYQKEYCKAIITEAQEAIEDLCVAYPAFATLYKLNLTRQKTRCAS